MSKGLVFFLFLFLVISSKSFAADKTPPSGSIKINNNSSYTSSSSVTLNLSATDKGSGMKKGKMRFSSDNYVWTSAENYKTSKSWSLASGDGSKTVYAKFCDSNGNWMKSGSSDTIILDTSKPSKPTVSDSGSSTGSSSSLYASWSSSDSTSGISEYQYQLTQDSSTGTVKVSWTSAGTSTSVTKSGLSLTSGKSYYFGVKAKNGAGLWSDIGYSDGIKVNTGSSSDTTPPTGSVKINSDASYCSSTSVTLTLSASDSGSEMGKMKFSNDNSSWSSEESYSTSKSWSLSSGGSTKTVYAKFSDFSGNWTTSEIKDSITLDTTAPAISSFSPDPNSFIYKGKTLTLSLTTSDSGDSSNEYQFSVDATVKQSWSSKTSYSWDTSGLDTKFYTLKFEAKDQGGSSSKTAKAFVLNEPVSPPSE